MFYCIFIKKFSKNFQQSEFFRDTFSINSAEFSKNSEIISNFQNQKSNILVFRLVRNHHIDQNLAKFSLKFLKKQIFFKNLQFWIFSLPLAPKLWNLVPLRPDLLGIEASVLV